MTLRMYLGTLPRQRWWAKLAPRERETCFPIADVNLTNASLLTREAHKTIPHDAVAAHFAAFSEARVVFAMWREPTYL